MNEIEEFVDERQKSRCIHCGQALANADANRDHTPSKGMLIEPYPENLPVTAVCKPCNEGFSLDEEYMIAFLGCTLAGSTEPDRQRIPRAARILERSTKLRERIERAKTEYKTRGGEIRLVWTPEKERIERVVLKNARGHAFFECGEPMLDEPDRVLFAPLQALTGEEREAFESVDLGNGWPEAGSRMLTRVMTGQDLENGWVIVQEAVYRYSVEHFGGMLVKSVLFEYLATEVCWDG